MHLRWPLDPLAQPFLDDFELRDFLREAAGNFRTKGFRDVSEPRPAIAEGDTILDEALPRLAALLRVHILAGVRKLLLSTVAS